MGANIDHRTRETIILHPRHGDEELVIEKATACGSFVFGKQIHDAKASAFPADAEAIFNGLYVALAGTTLFCHAIMIRICSPHLAKSEAGSQSSFMRFLPFLCFFCSALIVPASLLAASSQWHHSEGGSLRLVTGDIQDTSQILRGALEIRLKPGWKTYWADPGASGIPPSLTATIDGKPAKIEIGFPAPRRFDDGYALWSGYDHPLALALTLTLHENTATQSRLETEVFLGICETICIPLQAILSLDSDINSGNFEHETIVRSAFSALPAPAHSGFSLQFVESDDTALIVKTELPEGVVALDLFIAGTQMLTLDTPRQDTSKQRNLYRVPILSGSASAATTEKLFYTLITSNGAVSGHLTLP